METGVEHLIGIGLLCRKMGRFLGGAGRDGGTFSLLATSYLFADMEGEGLAAFDATFRDFFAGEQIRTS